MTIRELIEELEDIARRAGDRLDVVVHVEGEGDEWGDGPSGNRDVIGARFAGGSSVGLEVG